MNQDPRLKQLQAMADKVKAARGFEKKGLMAQALDYISKNAEAVNPEKFEEQANKLLSGKNLEKMKIQKELKDVGAVAGGAIGDAASYGKFSKKASLVGDNMKMPGLSSLLGIGLAARSQDAQALPREVTDQAIQAGLQLAGKAGGLAGAALSAEDLGPMSGTPEFVLEDPKATREQKMRAQMQLEAINKIANRG